VNTITTTTTTVLVLVVVVVVVVVEAAVVVVVAAEENINDYIPTQCFVLLYMRHNYGTCILQHYEQNRYYLYNLNTQLSTKVLLMSYLDITDD